MFGRARAVPDADRGDVDHGADADDAALVVAALADARAFGPLYRRYVVPVYRYCFRQLGGWEAAEDATAQVFVKALAGLPQCRPAAFRSWLFAIAQNTVVACRRAARPDRPLAAAAAVLAPGPSPEEIALAGERRAALEAAIRRLPPDQRAVVELRLAGLTGAEAAAALGRSPAAARMLQARAVARLRDLLASPAHPAGSGSTDD